MLLEQNSFICRGPTMKGKSLEDFKVAVSGSWDPLKPESQVYSSSRYRVVNTGLPGLPWWFRR